MDHVVGFAVFICTILILCVSTDGTSVSRHNSLLAPIFAEISSCDETKCKNGFCIDSTCVCLQGWAGENCDKVDGFCLDPENPGDVCNGNGQCANGKCICNNPYTGDRCEISGGDIPVCPNDCSGNGLCVQPTTADEKVYCLCLYGFDGEDCSQEGCQEKCKEHGTCIESPDDPDQVACQCQSGWSGPLCDKVTCPLCVEGQGRCDSARGVCLCNKGFSGTRCEQVNCPGIATTQDGDTVFCSAHGVCNTTSGLCTCFDGFSGNDCGIDLSKCPNQCSGHGHCRRNHTCHCYDPYGTLDCSIKIYPDCAEECTQHGKCEKGQCICETGWSGQNCTFKLCQNNCHQRGDCIDGVCECTVGFGGIDCSLECIHRCNGIGSCTISGVCDCKTENTSRYGADCSLFTCGELGCGKGSCDNTTGLCHCPNNYIGDHCETLWCSNNCHDHGVCISDNVTEAHCNCTFPYTGYLCTDEICDDPCSYHGHCLNNQCICDENYNGTNCEHNLCPNNCSLHGICVKGCFCDPHWGGFACDQPVCEVPCAKNGFCVVANLSDTPHCECNPPWTGEDCTDQKCDLACVHGICLNGACHCEKNWKGELCDREICKGNCSGHGECSTEKNMDFTEMDGCICYPGWRGENCSEPVECHVECIHGTCEDSECICYPGYRGPQCEDAFCPNNCSDHGFCNSLSLNPLAYVTLSEPEGCLCDPLWKGIDCSERDCVPSNCSEHGVCMNGTCQCYSNYTGEACEYALCTDVHTHPTNGNSGDCVTLKNPGETCMMSCNLGYYLTSGSLLRTCEKNGKYNGSRAVCSAITCDGTIRPPNTKVVSGCGKNDHFNGFCNLQCKAGFYQKSGINIRYCNLTETGHYPESDLVCEEMCTDSTTQPINGNAGDCASPKGPGELCMMGCNHGYYLSSGSLIRTCGSDGKYNASVDAICSEMCTDSTTSPIHGNAGDCSSPKIPGDTCMMACNHGFYLTSGSLARKCGSDGKYNASNDAVCSEMCADSTTHPTHGNSGDCSSPKTEGESCMMACNVGFYLTSGSLLRMCGSHGKYNGGSHSVCSAITCNGTPHPPNTKAVSGCGKADRFGTICNLTCNTGFYQKSGSNIRVCNFTEPGNYAESDLVCEAITCDGTSLPLNSHAVSGCTSSDKYNSKCVLTCNEGFEITNGSTIRKCTEQGIYPKSDLVCLPFNPCTSNPCGHNSNCVANGTEYECNCFDGYRSPHRKNKNCVPYTCDDSCPPNSCVLNSNLTLYYCNHRSVNGSHHTTDHPTYPYPTSNNTSNHTDKCTDTGLYCGSHGICSEDPSGNPFCNCSIGFVGPHCSDIPCNKTCNKGTCLNSKCHCDGGWFGTSCDRKSECNSDCSGHKRGFCIGDDNGNPHCSCLSPYFGEHCEHASCEKNCSGHGECLNNTCHCEIGWIGSNCEKPGSTGCEDPTCSHHGVCVLDKMNNSFCQCHSPYFGSHCQHSNCSDSCSGRGQCVDFQCVCDETSYGSKCEHVGQQLNLSNCPDSCNHHGSCIKNKTDESIACKCKPGWTGENCAIATCSPSCGPHQICRNGTCVCDEYSFGSNCEKLYCQNNCTSSDRGRCNHNTGICHCHSAYNGSSCEDFACPSNCSSHGHCHKATGKCECHYGYSGKVCKSFNQAACVMKCELKCQRLKSHGTRPVIKENEDETKSTITYEDSKTCANRCIQEFCDISSLF